MVVRQIILIHMLVIILCSCGIHGQQYLKDDEFLAWVNHYNLGRDDLEEIYPTWRRNADFVKEHNSLGHSYTLALNKFAHLDPGKLVRKMIANVTKFESTANMTINVQTKDIPAAVDWRDIGVVPPVANQGIRCNSDILFSIVDSCDAYWAIHHNNHLVLASYDEARDCCWKNGCRSSWDLALYQCIAGLSGLASAGEYHSPEHTCLSDKYSPVLKIKGGQNVVPREDEGALAEAVARQPIAVAVDASRSTFQFYDSGVYSDPLCSSTKLDHSMLVVGYGTTDREDYWIVKNSWGEAWGMNGYILMSRNNNNNCGIATAAMYPY